MPKCIHAAARRASRPLTFPSIVDPWEGLSASPGAFGETGVQSTLAALDELRALSPPLFSPAWHAKFARLMGEAIREVFPECFENPGLTD
jgi:hypothetical protein